MWQGGLERSCALACVMVIEMLWSHVLKCGFLFRSLLFVLEVLTLAIPVLQRIFKSLYL